FLAVTIASVALKFGPTEMTAVMVFAFSLVSVLGGRNMIKGFVALFIGIWICMIGMDPVGGPMRYTFGQVDLIDGVDFMIISVCIFGLSETFLSLSDQASRAWRLMPYGLRQRLPRVGTMT